MTGLLTNTFPLEDYDLDATLTSGQAFRWQRREQSWVGVIARNWVRLRASEELLTAEVAEPVSDWHWLTDYFQLELNLSDLLRTFPEDEPMRAAVAACRGLRLLRQEPWECLASFILSSSKQIVQIQQIVSVLCHRFGEPVTVPAGLLPANAFPSPSRLAATTEAELRACKMGFRAKYLLATAERIASGEYNLAGVGQLPVDHARAELLKLPGVGRKIADCVLLFAYGFQPAFPVDVWVMKGLRELYFSNRRVNVKRLHQFAARHFGANAGYAQQYLFHYMRTRPSPQRNTKVTKMANA
jgi:N-glycosylase/DNA lyase